MMWLGIRRKSSPVDDALGVSEYQANTHLRVQGQASRRPGMLSTSIAKQAGPIYEIMGASGLGSNFLTFDTGGDADGFTQAGGGGNDPWPPPPQPPKKRKPVGERQGACIVWGPLSDTGTDNSGTWTFTLPPDSCPGTLLVGAAEAGGGSGGSGSGGAGGDYGYSFDVLANGVPILSTGCLVNDGAFAAIPAGTTSLQYTVTASCVGGLVPGTWSILATSP